MAEAAATFQANLSNNHVKPPSDATEINQESPQSSDSQVSEPLSQSSSPNPSPEPPSPEPLPDCVISIIELRSFSESLSAFYRCFDDLKVHIDSIKAVVDSKLVRQNPPIALIPTPPAKETPIVETRESVPISSPKPNQESDKEKEKENGSESALSELETLCSNMSSRPVRRYILTNLDKPEMLREEVPKALKLAPNPAKLVLEGSGRFYLQGRKAYYFDSPMIPGREASIMMLECFLLMEKEDNAEIEKAIKLEAEQAAKAWKKRLLSEGSLASACEIDARGLLMFLGCYGVPIAFKYEDIKDLITVGNVKGIVSVLKRSRALMQTITEAIVWMVQNKMEVQGVDIAYTFDLQDIIKSRTVLKSYLLDAKESWSSVKDSARESSPTMYDANKKFLAALRSVAKCARRHNLDVDDLVRGWQVDEKITDLEEKMAEYESEKALQKRKADEIDSSRKRTRHTIHGLPQPSVDVVGQTQRSYLDRIPAHLSSSSYAPPETLSGSGSGSAVGIGVGGLSYSSLGRHGDVTYEDRLGSHYSAQQRSTHDLVAHYAAQPSSADLVARYAGQNPVSSGLYRTSSSPTRVLAATRTTPASELYNFADAVAESDAYNSRVIRSIGALPSHHHSSYLY